MQIDQKILEYGQNCFPYGEFKELCECIEHRYSFSSYRYWMWKIFQFGFVCGKRAERARRKKTA